jgi:alkanesulfonate monooxygenase SsuD/methylene tetrahydromethanopterin reductase-like flavin-dependent oxidoreductase (luciferase family)
MALLSLGLDTFGDITLGPDGQPKRMDQVLRDVVEEAVLADELGIDFIGLGEHHRADFAHLRARDRAGRHRRAHLAHPARHRRHGALTTTRSACSSASRR